MPRPQDTGYGAATEEVANVEAGQESSAVVAASLAAVAPRGPRFIRPIIKCVPISTCATLQSNLCMGIKKLSRLIAELYGIP